MSLCILQDLKDRLGITKTEHDDVLNAIITGFTARADTFCGRSLFAPAADITEYYTGQSKYLQLKQYPVISITSIIESWDYGFNEDALTSDTDYRLINSGKKGILSRLYTRWLAMDDSIQVIYLAGFIAAGETPQAGETALPGDLREAAIQQCTFIFKRRDDIGLSGVSFDGGGFQKFSAMKLLPDVADVLTAYRRITL